MDSGFGTAKRLVRLLVGVAAVAVPIALVAVIGLVIGFRSDEPSEGPMETTVRVLNSAAGDGGVPADTGGEAGPSGRGPEQQTPPTEDAAEREAERSPKPPYPGGRSAVVRIRDGKSVDLRDAPGGDVIKTLGDETEFGSPSVFWVRRQTSRWLGVSAPDLPNNEIAWLPAEPRLLEGEVVRHSIIVDLSARRARLFEMGRQVHSWPVTVGAPGTETPTGRFAITDTFAGDLHPAYGCCALALSATQPKLPPGSPVGDRIALHGTNGPLGVAASSGCVRSADRDLRLLLETVELGTPVLIRE